MCTGGSNLEGASVAIAKCHLKNASVEPKILANCGLFRRTRSHRIHGKYALALSGRSFENWPEGDFHHVEWLIQRRETRSPEPVPPDWRVVNKFGSHLVYHREL